MDPFLTLLHSFCSRLSETELSSLKFLLRGKIGKRKLEAAQSCGELFSILLEQQLITRDEASLLEDLLKTINRDDLVAELKQFVKEGEVSASDNQPDVHEKRRWIYLFLIPPPPSRQRRYICVRPVAVGVFRDNTERGCPQLL